MLVRRVMFEYGEEYVTQGWVVSEKAESWTVRRERGVVDEERRVADLKEEDVTVKYAEVDNTEGREVEDVNEHRFKVKDSPSWTWRQVDVGHSNEVEVYVTDEGMGRGEIISGAEMVSTERDDVKADGRGVISSLETAVVDEI